MKNYLTLIVVACLLSLSILVQAQSPFSKVFYDSAQLGIQANAIAKTLENGYVIAGEELYTGGLIIKMDSAGYLIWNKRINSGEAGVFNCIIPTNDSGFVLAGSVYDTARKLSEAFCVKINSKGDTIWSRAIWQSRYNNMALTVQQTYDNGYILTGNATELNFDSSGVFVAKLDANGDLEWTNIVTLANNQNIGYSVRQTSDSGYAIIGFMENYPPFDANAFLLRLTSGGEIVWAKKYNLASPTICFGNDLEITKDGFLCYLNTGNYFALLKTDFSGNVLWSKSISLTNYSYCLNCPSPKLHKTLDNGFIFALSNQAFAANLVKTDSVGNFSWAQNLFFNPIDVLESHDKGFLVLGNGPVIGNVRRSTFFPQVGIIKTDSLGNGEYCVTPGGGFSIADTITASTVAFSSLTGGAALIIHPVVSSISLFADSGCVSFLGGIHRINFDNGLSIYPNPSSGNFTLTFINPIIRGTLEIHNVIGEKIFEENIVNESKLAINLRNVSPGIYFIKVIDGNREVFEKLIIQ